MKTFDAEEPNREPDEDLDRCIERIKMQLGTILEHFDAVQIFATRHNNQTKDTDTVSTGSGNWNARKGMIRDWVVAQDEETKISRRKESE